MAFCYLRSVGTGERVVVLPNQKTVTLGRDHSLPSFRIDDARCSKRHLELRFERDKNHVILNSLGGNPSVVLKPGTGKKKKAVHKGESETLSNGDYLWIIPEVDALLYLIEIEIPTGESSANLLASKSDESLPTTVPEKSGGNVDKKRNIDEQSKTDLNAKPKPSTQAPATKKQKVDAPATTTTTTTTATTSSKPKKRPCKYGTSCYQKNPLHLKKFSHGEEEDDEENEEKPPPPPPPKKQEQKKPEKKQIQKKGDDEEDDEEDHSEGTEEQSYGELEKLIEKAGVKIKKDPSPSSSAASEKKTSTPPAQVPPIGDNPFKGKTIVITGKLERFVRKELEARLVYLGAKITGGVSGNTDILVAGDKPGSKLTRAKILGVKVVREDQLNKMFAASPEIDEEALVIIKQVKIGVLLARKWTPKTDPAGYWMSEKLDGVRAYWDGSTFISRLGNNFEAPDWFIEGLPSSMPLDGELWGGRGKFQSTVGIVKTKDKGDRWKEITYQVFDAPGLHDKTFEERTDAVKQFFAKNKAPYCRVVKHIKCEGQKHLGEFLSAAENKGGEGVMLRKPLSLYEGTRSSSLWKVKNFLDSEARVVGYTKLAPIPGAKDQNKVGTLVCKMKNGTKFSVGTGLSDQERENPPPIGSIITYRYQELTAAGIPRFPSYVGVRLDLDEPNDPDGYMADDVGSSSGAE